MNQTCVYDRNQQLAGRAGNGGSGVGSDQAKPLLFQRWFASELSYLALAPNLSMKWSP